MYAWRKYCAFYPFGMKECIWYVRLTDTARTLITAKERLLFVQTWCVYSTASRSGDGALLVGAVASLKHGDARNA